MTRAKRRIDQPSRATDSSEEVGWTFTLSSAYGARSRMMMKMKKGLLAAVVAASVIFAGSAIYWLADGRPGTPADFRERVNEAGLDVAWATSGPRGGAGSVTTECGIIEVEVNEIDGQLWIRWSERRERATQANIDALVSCER